MNKKVKLDKEDILIGVLLIVLGANCIIFDFKQIIKLCGLLVILAGAIITFSGTKNYFLLSSKN